MSSNFSITIRRASHVASSVHLDLVLLKDKNTIYSVIRQRLSTWDALSCVRTTNIILVWDVHNMTQRLALLGINVTWKFKQ